MLFPTPVLTGEDEAVLSEVERDVDISEEYRAETLA